MLSVPDKPDDGNSNRAERSHRGVGADAQPFAGSARNPYPVCRYGVTSIRTDEGNDMACHRYGVVSDTHGLLREELVRSLRDVEGIIHAGDVDAPDLLERLDALAPVTAVRGNMDVRGPLARLPRTEALKIGQAWVYVLHDLQRLDLDPAAAGFQAVISGHTHRPARATKNGVIYLNPGSAGPQRFTLPVSMAILEVSGGRIHTRFIRLEAESLPSRSHPRSGVPSME